MKNVLKECQNTMDLEPDVGLTLEKQVSFGISAGKDTKATKKAIRKVKENLGEFPMVES
jgi:hypothetical protein